MLTSNCVQIESRCRALSVELLVLASESLLGARLNKYALVVNLLLSATNSICQHHRSGPLLQAVKVSPCNSPIHFQPL